MIKKLLLLLFSFWLLNSCNKEQLKIEPETLYKEVISPDDIQTITPEDVRTYHKDIKYDYEYRTGTSGNYEYDYVVHGVDQDMDSVSGIINIKGEQGTGTIINKRKETIEIQVEWVDYGKLKGIDEEGNKYKLDAN